MKYPVRFPLEAIIWIAGLILLPVVCGMDSTISFCPFHNLGITFCPGCGLGRSIIYLFRLDIHNSFAAHPLGIPALLIILHRVYTLVYFSHPFSERNSNG